jgi:hypothetical protein
MRWLQRFLKEFSEDAQFRFVLGLGLAVLLLISATLIWS